MKIWPVTAIYFLDALQFRLRGLIWLLTGAVNALILLFFWWAVLQISGKPGSDINLTQITTYYLIMMTVSSITMCHNEEYIAFRQIYLGQIHQYLLQPYPYLARVFQQELVWRLAQGFFGVLILLAINFSITKISINFSLAMIFTVIISVILAMLLSFFYKSIIGLMAIWFTNVHGLLEITGVTELLLGGIVLPLHYFADPLRLILLYSPFGAMTYAPVSILSGFAPQDRWLPLILVQLLWVTIFGLGANLVFRRGIRRFGGVSQ